MATSAGAASVAAALEKLGLLRGFVVQEFGFDRDVDDELRLAIEELTESELQDEDYRDVADAILIWFRDDDDDLIDTIVDALTNLAEGGFMLLATPKPGREGHVDPSEVEDSALTAGLHTAGSANVSADWAVTRLVAPKSPRR